MHFLSKRIRDIGLSFLTFGLLIICLGLPSLASAMLLKAGCPQSSSMLVLDTVSQVIHRGDMGAKMELPISQDPISSMEIILAPGTYNTASGDVTLQLQFRLESIPEADFWHFTDEETPIRIEGPGIPWENVYLNVSRAGSMEGGEEYWAEFAATINYSTGYRRLLYTLTLPSEIRIKFYIDRVFKELEMLDVLDRPAGPVDHWFQIIETSFGEGCYEGAPLSAYSEFTMNEQPAAGIPVNISGVNAIYEPSTATTDAEGIFGVVAFTDPEVLSSEAVTSDQVSLNTTTKSNEITAEGELLIEFKETVRKRGLSGAYCEVILVEGTVRVIGGDGTVQKGDILRPGTKLSLSTGWGTIAQIYLRFINGSTVEVVQDVYTNACVADIIEIGKTGFVNQSVIQGATPLASVSRELCETYGNLPNTPEEWARTAGRVAVQTGASMIVPGSGIAAFCLKYGVKKAAGEAYDYYIITSPQAIEQNVQENALKLNDTNSVANKLALVDFYYDGSTRVASNLGDLPVYVDTSSADTPLILASAGDWVEIDGSVERIWQDVYLGQIDGEGPILRLGCEADTENYTTRFELIARDTAGVDSTSFLAWVNGEPSTAFQAKDQRTWQAEFFGTPPTGTISFRLLDKFGNESFLEWSAASMPEAPALLETLPGKWDKGSSYISWETPIDLDPSELLCYEVRQIWRSDPLSWTKGPWISVGRAEEVWLDVPEGVARGTAFYLEIRTVTQNGISGFSARSEELAYAETQPNTFEGPPMGGILNLLLSENTHSPYTRNLLRN